MEKSESIKNIAMALVKFHSSVGKIKKDSTNPFFKSKYADLSDIQDAIQEPLNESGLVISQLPMGKNELTTILIHADSGEFIMGTYEMAPVKNDPQSIGSCITYQKRYALSAILNLNLDADDDGNAASKKTAPQIDYVKTLTDCTTLEQLKSAYVALPKGKQAELLAKKDEIKAKLTPAALPSIPLDRYNKLVNSLKADGADTTGILKQAREAFTFTEEQEKELTSIIAAKAASKKAA
jgi:hypothetical protein